MTSLRVVAAVVVAGVLATGTFLLLQDRGGGEAEPARVRLTTPPLRASVLTDAQGTALGEFTGDCKADRYEYLCERVRAELLASGDDSLVTRKGLTIKTAIDPRAQRAAQEAVDRHVHHDDAQVAAQAMVAPGSGEVRALATNRGDALSVQQGGTAMVYPLAAAFERGLRSADGFPYTRSYRAPAYSAFRNCKGENVADPSHTVVNDRREHDAFTTLESGTQAGENTFFLKLTERVGLCESVQMAKRLGLGRADGRPLMEFETFALGTNEVDPVTLAGSYATLAARGLRCAPRVVTEIRGDGGFVRTFPPRCEQVLEAPVADAVTGVLTGALAKSPLKGLGRDAAGMDGTTDTYSSATYAGYTPALASAVSLVHPDGGYKHPLVDVTIGGEHHAEVRGTSIPGQIWKDSMKAALDGTTETSFTRPDAARFGGCRDACAN
ncbi:hypothetical protein SAMN05444920_101752 [Nonomuraea solani]|uniref:Uncharacterized protein n=1 Tax=Nonomuraea solani TaxID=1144553 RepID=A0A1H5V3V1_9ACTN|nr:hypothetical protein [Nonomuraea solani]SEF81913.1 hypothetical protein SAMN05444920_101752 [Nonomuraea solani]